MNPSMRARRAMRSYASSVAWLVRIAAPCERAEKVPRRTKSLHSASLATSRTATITIVYMNQERAAQNAINSVAIIVGTQILCSAQYVLNLFAWTAYTPRGII